MKTSDIVSMGSRNLLRRKTRTLLTIVGVLVGATAIVLMISIALGMNASLDASIARMGDLTLIEVQQYTYRQTDSSSEWQQYENKLNDEVVEQIRQLDGVLAVTPLLEVWSNFNLIVNGKYQPTWMNLQGVDPSFLPYMGIEIAKGEMPGVNDKNFLLIAVETEYNFYRIGKNFNWNKEFYYADGTRKPPKVDFSNPVIAYMQGFKNEDGYWDYDKQEWITTTSARKPKFTKYYFDKVAVMAESQKNYESSWYSYVHIDTVKALQTEIYKSQKNKNSVDNYSRIKIKTTDMVTAEAVQKVLTDEMGLTLSSYSLSETRKELQSQQATLQMMLGIIGAVSLLVAAIGIMNTMYMSIYERTKEIGVMKVLGCPLGGIQTMFLFEAGMIGFFGGLAGIGFSMLASYIMNNVPALYNALSKMSSTSALYYNYAAEEAEKVPVSIIPLWLIGLTIIFATIIGLFAGYLPAKRATKISALEAIRNE